MASSGGAPIVGKAPAAPRATAKPPSKPIPVKAHTRAAPTPRPQRAGRPQRAAPMNPLLDPNQTLSGKSLLQAAQSLAAIQTKGPLAELQQQIAANNAQTRGTVNLTGGFYNQLEPYVQQGVGQQGQIAAGLNTQLQNIGTDTQSQLQGIGQNAMSSLLKYAPQGEGGIANAATSDLAAQIARQQGLAAQQSGTYRAFGANQGANYQGLASSQLGTFGLQGQEALKGIAQSGTVKNEPLVQKIADLRAQQGALTATDLGKLRQQEIANQVARAGLGIKTQANQIAQARVGATLQGQRSTAATAAARLKVQRQNDLANQELRAAGIRVTSQNDLANQQLKAAALAARQTGTAQKPLSLVANNRANAQIGEIITAVQQWQQDGIKNSKGKVLEPHPTNAQMRQILGSRYSGPLVQAAFELKGWGIVTPQTAQALHNMGIRNTTFRNAPVKVGQPPKASPNPLLPPVGTKNPLAPASTGL